MKNTRLSPKDNQVGDPLGGEFLHKIAIKKIPREVLIYGLSSNDYLFRAILQTIFKVQNVKIKTNLDLSENISDNSALIIARDSAPNISWHEFCNFVDNRHAVVDIVSAQKMLANDNYQLNCHLELCDTETTIPVFLHNTNVDIYPKAPRLKVCDSINLPAFSDGDEFHFYNPKENNLELYSFLADDQFDSFKCDYNVKIWAVSAANNNPAVILITTKAGGLITVMDLQSVNHFPQDSGAEGPAIQVFLNALGKGSATFSKFICSYASYDEYIEAVKKLVYKYSNWAEIEKIGKSTNDRDTYLVKVKLNDNSPALLASTAIHSLEWGPSYGVLRYFRFLLEECRKNSIYANQALASRQFWWVLCANPDAWETRDQEALGVNLNRNFPSEIWSEKPAEYCWNSYSCRFAKENTSLEFRDKTWGTHAASEKETQNLIKLLDRKDEIVSVVDFHETVSQYSFLHQQENDDNSINEQELHLEAIEDLSLISKSRFWSNSVPYSTSLGKFKDYRFQEHINLERLIPSVGISSYLKYAINQGYRGRIVEATGCDCTHYQTIRRLEYAANILEQSLFAEYGRLLRNPFGETWSISINILQKVKEITFYIYNLDEQIVREETIDNISSLDIEIPPGGRAFIKYNK